MKKVIILIVILIIGFFAAKVYWNFLQSPLDSNGKVQAFVISKGESTDSITKRLEKENLIRSQMAFKLYLKLNGKAGKIAAGDFKLSPSMNFDQIMTNLEHGTVDKWVTLIEGWRVEEMAARLSVELGIDGDEFIKQSKEGYMFPDTYLFNPKATVPTLVSILENTFDQKYDDSLQQKIKANGLTEAQGVILASIVEREARSDNVRQQVASILLKRIKIGMGINADATVQYALGYQPNDKTWWKRNLTRDDLKVNSPYNTYIHVGLPPTPICNPSLSSLNAVANANTATPYLYYYHDSKGNSYYGKTLDEHNANVANHP